MKIFSTIMLTVLIFITACSKSDNSSTNGAAQISGKITYMNGATGTETPAPFASVYICFGTLTAKANPDEIVKTDSAGNYTVKLTTGNYYFSADFTDANGFYYKSHNGVSAAINNTTDKPVINMLVQ